MHLNYISVERTSDDKTKQSREHSLIHNIGTRQRAIWTAVGGLKKLLDDPI
jgi:hypothetical protein